MAATNQPFINGKGQALADLSARKKRWPIAKIRARVRHYQAEGFSPEYIRGYWFGHGWKSNSTPMRPV